jgi:hypothetical protein
VHRKKNRHLAIFYGTRSNDKFESLKFRLSFSLLFPIVTKLMNILPQRTDLYRMSDCLQPILKRYARSPYGMHYWYFNIVTPSTQENYSYILANVMMPAKLNGAKVSREKDAYYSVLSDFKNENMIFKQEKVEVTTSKIETDNFFFTIKNGQGIIRLNGQEFRFNKLLPDSTINSLGPLYDWSSVNLGNGKNYLNAENVMKRGPLPPWNWLHFFLEDGTFIETFDLPFQRSIPLQVNNTQLIIQKINYTSSSVQYFAKKDDLYFNIYFDLDTFKARNTYSPFLSPSWTYDQYSPHLLKIETNLEGININQRGGGILEIAKGWCL